jgi:RimJ/RimL family protein N-acetyltransferase
MFKTEIEKLYNFQSKEELVRKFSVVKQDRKSVVLYDFSDVKWILMPDNHPNIRWEDIDLYNKFDPTNVMFRENDFFNDILHHEKCRLLTDEDRFKFMEFHKACPNSDKEKGMVSLADPTVFGCYEGGKIVCVASLWNWGDNLSDIGVLTHPEYRGMGYAKSVCQRVINEVDRHIIWRCDMKNIVSNNLAKRLGFKEVGKIYNLVKRI